MQLKPMIEVNKVHRKLTTGGRDLQILQGISFTVNSGEWVALTGPSGSGKSTLLGILAGIDRPSSGNVMLDSYDISNQSESHLAHIRNELIGIVFQSFNLIPTMTAQENVEAPLYIHPRRREARALASEMLNQVGLGERARHLPHQLSGGEQQRVAIARALVTRPRVLLADEPTGNLDSVTSKQVMLLLQHLRTRMGLTIVMVTHDPNVAAYADRCLHIMDGRLAGSYLPGNYATATAQISAEVEHSIGAPVKEQAPVMVKDQTAVLNGQTAATVHEQTTHRQVDA